MKNRALAILAGGYSRRLGTDKGLFNPLGDEMLISRQLRLLANGFAEVLVVVKDDDQRQLYQDALGSGPEINVVCDADYCPRSADAALTGIQTALKAALHDEVTVIPVDQLGVRALHLSKLTVKNRAFADAEGSPMAFPSLWHKTDLTRINACAEAGQRSIIGVLRTLNTTVITEHDYHDELNVNGNTKEQIHSYLGEPLLDKQQRRLHYLRFSLIEACNLSCNYCLPEGYPEWYRHKAKLSTADIETVLRGFRKMGFRKVRFTGGEPSLHKGCKASVATARKLGFEEIAITTNGLLLDDLQSWINAGLTTLNVSLDTIDPDLFKRICKGGDVNRVINLIEAAAQTDLKVKVNTVLQRNLNGQLEPLKELIQWAQPLDISLRFIELMDTKLNGDFANSERVLGSEVWPLLQESGYITKSKKARVDLSGPADEVSSPQHLARFGFINPISCNFCDACNRLRVTARGNLRLCLFGENETPLNLASPEGVAASVRAALGAKPSQHYLLEGKVGDVSTFRTIGG